MPTFVRVVNQQLIQRSILIDKIDRSQGQFETGTSYAQVAKQAVYVPFSNPNDSTVKGYIDMVPTDEVLLSLAKGTLLKLANAGYVSTTLFNSSLTAAPVVTAASVANSNFSVTGTTLASLSPDVTYVTLTNLVSGVQTTSIVSTLTDLLTLANQLKAKFNTHRTQAGIHPVNDTTNVVTAANATDLASALTLLNQIKTEYNAHRTQATVHSTNDTTNVTSSSNATDFGSAATLANELKADFDAHIASTTFHSLADATNVVTAAGITSVTSTKIIVPTASITGTPTTGWKVVVRANSKNSNTFTMP